MSIGSAPFSSLLRRSTKREVGKCDLYAPFAKESPAHKLTKVASALVHRRREILEISGQNAHVLDVLLNILSVIAGSKL